MRRDKGTRDSITEMHGEKLPCYFYLINIHGIRWPHSSCLCAGSVNSILIYLEAALCCCYFQHWEKNDFLPINIHWTLIMLCSDNNKQQRDQEGPVSRKGGTRSEAVWVQRAGFLSTSHLLPRLGSGIWSSVLLPISPWRIPGSTYVFLLYPCQEIFLLLLKEAPEIHAALKRRRGKLYYCYYYFLIVSFLCLSAYIVYFLIKKCWWHGLIRLHGFPVYSSMTHHLHTDCVPTTQSQIFFNHHIFDAL